jgi:peptidoglycan/LPS O-acetylase OafA/YrhL
MVLPRIRLLPQAQLGQDSAHSLLISLLRGLAAIEVAAGHLRAEMFPGLREVAAPTLGYQALAFATGFAHQAVIVFFVISGWLVGGSLLNKYGQPGALGGYAVDRISRLWTVLLPTFLVMLLIGLFTGELRPGAIDFSGSNDFSATTLAGNLFGLQTVSMAQFGGNYPLWSLANETWYYLMFPLLVASFGSASGLRRIASGVLLFGIAVALPYPITLYFLIWLLGAVFSRVKVDAGPAVRVTLLALFATVGVLARLMGSNDDISQATFLQDLVFGLACMVFLSSMQVKTNPASWPLARLRCIADFFAEFSFTLYVLHVPLIKLMRHVLVTLFGSDRLTPGVTLDYIVYGGMLGTLLTVSFISYLAFESHTPAVRRWIKGMLKPQALRQV